MLLFQLCAEDSPSMFACRCGVDSFLDDGDMTLRLCFSGVVFKCYCSTACIPCLHEDQIYSHECKDEVKCEPEVVIKVPAGGGEVLRYRDS